MFCLRSWIPILFFLTNASPIYLILFISATYVLNRPCVYCSFLLAILVISLFDFHSNWFEPRYSHPSSPIAAPASKSSNASSYLPNGVLDTLSIFSAAMNGTAGAMADAVLSNLKTKVVPEASMDSTMAEWVKALFRREWRISCLDVVIRL